ncbi:MAG: PAS domain-containing protein [Dehalococcoidia bacterium]
MTQDAATDTTLDAARLLEQSPDALIYAGTDGMIRYWNAAAERMFRHPASEALGQSLDMIIPENFRDRHWTGFDRALEAHATKYVDEWLPTRALRGSTESGGDPEEFYVELGFAVILDAAGEVDGVLASARDITERFERDREMRRRLRDLEAKAEASS